MSLGAYIHEAYMHAAELKESFSESEIEELREAIATGKIGRREWLAYCSDNAETIAKYLRQTPLQRSRRRQQIRSSLKLAALQSCELAALLLERVDRAALSPGGPYREMTAVAAFSYWEICGLAGKLKPWPFGGESPFV